MSQDQMPIKICPHDGCYKVHPSGTRVCDACGYEFYPSRTVIGVNDPKPATKPEAGMKWVRIKGGPYDGKWLQCPK